VRTDQTARRRDTHEPNQMALCVLLDKARNSEKFKMKTIIHVNQHVVRANAKHGTNDPVLTVKTYKGNTYAHTVTIDGPSKIVYSVNKPLSCGARVWVETQSEVHIQ